MLSILRKALLILIAILVFWNAMLAGYPLSAATRDWAIENKTGMVILLLIFIAVASFALFIVATKRRGIVFDLSGPRRADGAKADPSTTDPRQADTSGDGPQVFKPRKAA